MKETRIVLMGLGSIGSKHVDTLLSMGYHHIVAVDPRPMPHEERIPVLSHLEDLGAWKPTHAVICSPPDLHYPQARYFLQAGIPTFIEKPMTVRAYEAIFLNEVAKNAGTYIGVGYMERAHPHVQEARRWAIVHYPYRAEFFCYWRSTTKTYELDVMRESSHAIDTALYLFGKPDEVKRFKSNTSATCKFHYADGREVTVAMNMRAPVVERIIRLYSGSDELSVGYGRTKEEWDVCYRTELQAFLDGTPLCTGEDGLRVVEVLEQLA